MNTTQHRPHRNHRSRKSFSSSERSRLLSCWRNVIWTLLFLALGTPLMAAILERCNRSPDGLAGEENTCKPHYVVGCVGQCYKVYHYGVGSCHPNGIWCFQGSNGYSVTHSGKCVPSSCACVLNEHLDPPAPAPSC